MCGIAGIVDLGGAKRATSVNLKILSKTLQHRGPDDEGFLLLQNKTITPCFGEETPANVAESLLPFSPVFNINKYPEFYLGLLHRRLSILDISPSGHQPMCTPNKSVWITFNGEIYNYIELRTELIEKGHKFFTKTDTEVLLASYLEWGTDCVTKFNGMWAFVIFDSQKNILFGSRDRTGVKPFYYHLDKKSFTFSSELKALNKLDFIPKKVNGNAAMDFLLFNKVEHRESSIFDAVLELFPAHNFTLNLQNLAFKKWKYYTPAVNFSKENITASSFEKHVSKTKFLIENAIKVRLRSDVNIGTCLSGGIDSSSIVAVIDKINSSQHLGQVGSKLKTFTCSFAEAKYDESNFARKVIESTNTEWFQVYPKAEELVLDLEKMIYAQDLPLLSTSTYAQYKVMQLAAKNNVKVLLNGQGADELFAGYAQHKYTYEKSKGMLPLIANSAKNGELKKLLRNFGIYDFLPHLNTKSKCFLMQYYYEELKFINPEFIQANLDAFNQHKESKTSSLNLLLQHEYFDGPLKRLLKCEDRNSMHFSIESRTPFADDIQLIDYVFNIPSSYKLSTGVSKSILREAMQSYLPKEIYNRTDKMGFVTPNNSWVSEIKNNVRHYFEELDENIFNKKAILKEFDSFFTPKSEVENYRIFKFISFVLWQSKFNLLA